MRYRWLRAVRRRDQARSRCGRSSNLAGRRPGGAMQSDAAAHARDRVDAIYRSESRRVLATLIRLLGDFDLAEEAVQDAFASAVEQWADQGIPANPRAWLISTGRFKAIDRLRKTARLEST